MCPCENMKMGNGTMWEDGECGSRGESGESVGIWECAGECRGGQKCGVEEGETSDRRLSAKKGDERAR